MDKEAEVSAQPFETLDFHDAFQEGIVTYFLASRSVTEESDPYTDMEGVVFRERHIFVLRKEEGNSAVISHYLTKARIAHTAMRINGSDLLIFLNAKMQNHSFAMNGYLYRLTKETLRPTSVTTVFEEKNWGWSPWIDENGLVHHGDSETPGNPYLIGTTAVHGKVWDDLAPMVNDWHKANRLFDELKSADRKNGYLTFISVDPEVLTS